MKLLRGQRKIVNKYWNDVTAQIQDFTKEGVVASPSWPYQVNLLQADKKPIASTVPQEGATGWADTTMMHAKAPHPNCAYMWLEHSLKPKVQGDVAAMYNAFVDDRWDGLVIEGDRELVERLFDGVRGTGAQVPTAVPA